MKKLFITLLAALSVSQLMCNDIDWSFPPETLSTVGQNATDAQIAMDPNGNSVAVWLENGLVKSKSKPADMPWSAPSTISGFSASSPLIGMDASGNATAVWLEGSIVKAATKTLSGAWSSAATLSGNNASNPALAVGAAGAVIAGWVRTGDVQTSTKLAGGAWGNAATINGATSARPMIAIGGTGANTRAVVVWEDVTSSVRKVYASTKLIAAAWGTKQIISTDDPQAAYAQVAVDETGRATAVWYGYDVAGSQYSSVLVRSASMSSSGSWSAPSSLSKPGIRNPATLAARIGYDYTGNAIALWTTSFDDETFYIQSAIKPVNGCWAESKDLVKKNLYALQGDLAVSSLGNALALYMSYNGAALQIQSAELDITGFMDSVWSVPLSNSDGTQNGYPQVAATLTGNTVNSAAVWINYDGMHTSVAASTGIRQTVLPPSALTVTQSSDDFGVFTEYYNTLQWEASEDSNVAGYLIYRNGAFLQRVDANVLEFVDNNRAQNGSVTYGVAAIDNQQTHSPIITVSYP